MSVSTRTRFEIFKRDKFRCHYCGRTPLNAILHVDHVTATANGGSDDASNLITSCDKCNLGKSDVPLDEKRYKSEFTSEAEKEHAEQIREYLRVQRDILDAKKEAAAVVLDHWQDIIGEWHWSLPRYIPRAVEEFGIARACEAAEIVSRRGIGSKLEQVRYFCGVLRRWREERDAPRAAPANPTPSVEDRIRDAEWKTAFNLLRWYWSHRVGSDVPPGFEDSLRPLLGSTKDKPATLSIGDVYSLIDIVAWADGDPEEVTFPRLLAEASGSPALFSDASRVERGWWFSHSTNAELEDSHRHSVLDVLEAVAWEMGFGGVGLGDDVYKVLWEVAFLRPPILIIQALHSAPHKTASALREALAREVYQTRRSTIWRNVSCVEQWPEYKALLAAEDAKGA